MHRSAILIAACTLLAGCSIKDDRSNCSTCPVELTVDVDGDRSTKTTSGIEDSRVNGMQVFVFRMDGTLDGSSSASGSSVTVSCTAGERVICAVVNAPSVGRVTTLAALRRKVSQLQENTPSNFIMYGQQEKIVAVRSSVTLPVTRLLAKITIERISTDWTAEAYRTSEFRLTGLYVINAAGEWPLYRVCDSESTPEPYIPDLWFNQRRNNGDVPSLLSDSFAPVSIPNKGSYAVSHSFFCYPNPVMSDSSDETWCPRKTRLVVEADLDGTTYYYPVTFNAVEPNRSYVVRGLTITRPGALDPDMPLDSEDLSCTVIVTDWLTGDEINERI